MPIVSPQLDDLTYDRITTELIRRIPVYSPEWTDYNDSDPGITLIQLFAYLAEMIGYRLNQVPQKSQASLLQLLGVTLSPATPAKTQLALLLTDPTKLKAYALAKGASIKANSGTPPPAFETDQDLLVLPIEPAALVATYGPRLWAAWGDRPRDANALTVLWDGQTPKLKDMPLGPIPLAPATPTQNHLWIGLNFNSDPGAGAKGGAARLTIQYNSDQQPDSSGFGRSGTSAPAADHASPIDWLWYYDARAQDMARVSGAIDDTTNRMANSGTLSFVLPDRIGPIPAERFGPFRPASSTSPNQTCVSYATNMQAQLSAIHQTPGTAAWMAAYATAVQNAVNETISEVSPAPTPPIPNPLDPKFYGTPGWLRIDLPAGHTSPLAGLQLRIATFNAVPATNATTVANEVVGVADGRPGQTYQLANGNIQPGTLSLAVQEQPAANNAPLTPWTAVASLDPYGPFDSVFVLDAETGALTFGDGTHGRIPPLIPQSGNIVALSYVWGGGSSGNVAVGAVTVLNSAAPGVAAAVNYVAATGGSDTETQAQAQTRASKLLSSRSRAVSADDFAWYAAQTPGVNVARTQIVPRRRPLGSTQPSSAGLADSDTPGVVTVIVVPQVGGPEPTPSASFLNAVSQSLDSRRLVTTEVYVAPPQYARLHNVKATVAGRPGYTRAQLQAAVSAQLAGYLHVLSGGDGGGFPFGGELHMADLVSRIYQVAGVARVDSLTADFTRTRSLANPREGRLVQAPAATSLTEYSSLTLAPEETASFDAASFILSTAA